MNTPTESSVKNIGKINDIQVPKSYILKQLHNRYLDKINDYIKEIEQYIEDEIHDTHLTHVTPNIKDHIDILVSKFNLHGTSLKLKKGLSELSWIQPGQIAAFEGQVSSLC